MKKMGVLYGMENAFPGAPMEPINAIHAGVVGEAVRIGTTTMAERAPYDVIVDRIFHDIAYYRSHLKNAVLTGTIVIGNPFWWSADDKLFNRNMGGSEVPPPLFRNR